MCAIVALLVVLNVTACGVRHFSLGVDWVGDGPERYAIARACNVIIRTIEFREFESKALIAVATPGAAVTGDIDLRPESLDFGTDSTALSRIEMVGLDNTLVVLKGSTRSGIRIKEEGAWDPERYPKDDITISGRRAPRCH